MSESLKTALATLERLLEESGARIVGLLSPGIDRQAVASRLSQVGLTPTSEVTTWFAWHDGAQGSHIPTTHAEVVPGAAIYDLQSLCNDYLQLRRISAEVARTPGYPVAAGDHWPESWFPLLNLFGKGYVAVDLAAAGEMASPVHVVWHDSGPEERARVVWPSIEALVNTAVRRFREGTYFVDAGGIVQGSTLDA